LPPANLSNRSLIIHVRVRALFIEALKDALHSRFPGFRFGTKSVPEQRIQHLQLCFMETLLVVVSS
jgi:hypothetical protein